MTALVEGPTGLLLLVWPALVFALLFAWHLPAPETLVMGRIASTGVLSIGIASWVARADARAPAQLGVLAGVLTYNALGAAVLVFAGTVLSMAGVALWPASRITWRWPPGRSPAYAACARPHVDDSHRTSPPRACRPAPSNSRRASITRCDEWSAGP